LLRFRHVRGHSCQTFPHLNGYLDSIMADEPPDQSDNGLFLFMEVTLLNPKDTIRLRLAILSFQLVDIKKKTVLWTATVPEAFHPLSCSTDSFEPLIPTWQNNWEEQYKVPFQ